MNDGVAQVKVLEALRSLDPKQFQNVADVYNLSKTPHLLEIATTSAPPVLKAVLQYYHTQHRDINEINAETGNTPLHVVALANNLESARILLAEPLINDQIPNKNGDTASDLSPTEEMQAVFTRAQNKFLRDVSVKLKTAFSRSDLRTLEHIYDNPRVQELVDLNGLDPDTGNNVLHDAAAAGNLPLVQFILDHRGDPAVRNSHKQAPVDLARDEKVQQVLAAASKNQTVNSSSLNHEGFLKKWTNFTQGYRTRWFVLQDGVLRYYKSPHDKNPRDTLSLAHASIKVQSSVQKGFELRFPNRKLVLKAPHPNEANGWVWALQNAITAAKDAKSKKRGNSAGGAVSGAASTKSAGSPQVGGSGAFGAGGAGGAAAGAAAGAGAAGAGGLAVASGTSNSVSPRPSFHSGATTATGATAAQGHARSTSVARSAKSNRFIDDLDNGAYHTSDDDDDNEDEPLTEPTNPAAIIASLDALGLLVQDPNNTQHSLTTIDQLKRDVVAWHQFHIRAIKRMQANLEQSDNQQRLWAQNCRALEIKLEKAEGQLYLYNKQNAPVEAEDDDIFYDTLDEWRADQQVPETIKEESTLEGAGAGAVGGGAAQNVSGHSGAGQSVSGSGSAVPEAAPAEGQSVPGSHGAEKAVHNAQGEGAPQTAHVPQDAQAAPDAQSHGHGHAATGAAAVGATAVGAGAGAGHGDAGEAAAHGAADNAPSTGSSTGATDKAGAATGAAADKTGARGADSGAPSANTKGLTPAQAKIEGAITETNSFAGYEDGPRKKLAINADDRPKMSLWGVLKSLIGKDMTKMTLPVTFNECTNLLQRSAEDMEYVDLLDKAAASVDDAGLRMAYIAAFAASSYSSTIGRVAKPFNPILGETFEYCRPDKDFRMFSEQVSHHPPIGALLAESPRWSFFGHSNVKSKFNGRSFDIVPVGLWYLTLRPNKGAEVEEELYTFRKVTSSVVGIMVGNPVVDNYGTMEIKNHTTGVTCTFDFKPRGWRGASAYKVEGVVKSKEGKELYNVGGTWNDKIYASKSSDSKHKVLLWQVHDRPSAPFNLTPFAITLNALPDRLKEWLPPTDTRFRPDQRDMEEGRYDQAADSKVRVEEKQRAARRKREETGEAYQPHWFQLEKHPVTGEEYYVPVNDYWGHRAHHDLKDAGDIF